MGGFCNLDAFIGDYPNKKVFTYNTKDIPNTIIEYTSSCVALLF